MNERGNGRTHALCEARIDATQREIDGLRAEIDEWLAARIRHDTLRQYTTQLTYLGDALRGALAGLRGALERVGGARGEVYERCRGLDLRLALVRRIWSFYATKFAQRDEPRLRAVLAAADEVVWSCYARVFAEAQLRSPDLVRGPAPLPFLLSAATPEAIPRDEPPLELRPDNDDELVREQLKRLAVPVIGLPYRCVAEPWWLALLAHEVGHHLEFDLGGWQLIGEFRRRVGSAAGAGWMPWAEEVFADACSVCSLGPWAVRAMTEVEEGKEETMLARDRGRYPPALVRLALLDAFARVLGHAEPRALGGLTPEAPPEGDPDRRGAVELRRAAIADFAAVPGLAAALADGGVVGVASLPELHGWHPRVGAALAADVAEWSGGLLGRERMYPERSLDAPRVVIAAAVAAWDELTTLPDRAARADAAAGLAERLLEVVPRTREEGTRAAPDEAVPDGKAAGEAIFAQLVAEPIAA